MDHLRFFAAVLIVFFHLLAHHYHRFLHQWHFDVGVPVFFTLSGFLFFTIAVNSNSEINYWRFIYNRFLRIYPLIIFLFFITITLIKHFTVIGYLNLFGLNLADTDRVSWGIGDWGYQYLSFNWWTVGVEFVFYLVFPFIYRFYKANGVLYLFGLLLLILLFRYVFFVSELRDYGARALSVKLNYSVFGNFDIFITGMIAGHFYRYYLRDINRAGSVLFKLIFVCYVFFMFLFMRLYLDDFNQVFSTFVTGILSSGLIIFYILAFKRDSVISAVLSYCGTLSFSIYLLHNFIADALNALNRNYFLLQSVTLTLRQTALIQTVFITIPLILIVSSLTYYVIEKPFLNMRVTYFKE